VAALERAPPSPSRQPPRCLGGRGVKSPPSAYITSPRGEFDTSGLREFLEELSSTLPYAPPLFLSSSWLCSHIWSFDTESEDTPHIGRRQATELLVQILLLPLLCWTGTGRSHSASYVCEYYEVLHVRHYVGALVLSDTSQIYL
jgi:hypothetical protein